MASDCQRPLPDDWREVAATMTPRRLVVHYRTSYRTIKRWMMECPVDTAGGRRGCGAPVPDDWTDIAPRMTKPLLRKRYRVADLTLERWIAESGVDVLRPYRAPMPEGFYDVARGSTFAELMRHYRRDLTTIKRWLVDAPDWVKAGMEEARRAACQAGAKAGAASARKAKAATQLKPKTSGWKLPMRPDVQAAPTCRADEAMRYMQRFGPCYPLRVLNKVLDGYSFRGIRMTAAQIIAEAEKRGWNPNAWREIAA